MGIGWRNKKKEKLRQKRGKLGDVPLRKETREECSFATNQLSLNKVEKTKPASTKNLVNHSCLGVDSINSFSQKIKAKGNRNQHDCMKNNRKTNYRETM